MSSSKGCCSCSCYCGSGDEAGEKIRRSLACRRRHQAAHTALQLGKHFGKGWMTLVNRCQCRHSKGLCRSPPLLAELAYLTGLGRKLQAILT